MRVSRKVSTALVCLVGFGAGACTDNGFHRFPEQPPPPPDHTITIEGTYCASSPEELVFPVKILFVLDDSGSMGGSDPQFRRVAAARDLVADLIDEPGVEFGVERFQDAEAFILTDPVFTDDQAILDAALNNNQHGPGGNTPYVGALSVAAAALTTDIQSDLAAAKRTRYVVIFLSDGVPTDDAYPYSAIAGSVALIKSLEAQGAGEVTLHTAYLQDGGNNTEAEQLLQGMAFAGGGEFRNFENGDAIDFSDFDITAISRDFRPYFPVLVTNLNTRLIEGGLTADSDADGLSDTDEQLLGSDPLLFDTDGDGCSDAMEARYAGWDPLVHGTATEPQHCVCDPLERALDTDGDGLTDCEERWLSLNPIEPDSDINADGNPAPDNMIDMLEVLWNLGRTKWDANEDYDVDGVSNLVELATHTDPNRNDEILREDYAYRYEYVDQQPENPRCYDFKVTNIFGIDTGTGQNTILLYFVEAPQDDPFGESTVRKVERTVSVSGGVPDPQHLRIEADEFVALDQ